MIYVVHQKRSALKLQNVQYVGRPTVLGNPFTHLKKNTKAMFIVDTVEDAVSQYKKWLDKAVMGSGGDNEVFNELKRLTKIYRVNKILTLSCWCKDELDPRQSDHICHADVLRQEIMALASTIDYYESLGHILEGF